MTSYKEAVRRRRERLIQDSHSLPVDAASRALRGDADDSAAELADMFERAGPLVRGASEVVAWEDGRRRGQSVSPPALSGSPL